MEDLTAVYIDDSEEKKKYQQISHLVESNGLFRLYWLADQGILNDKDLDQTDVLSDEDKKALVVLSLMKGRERRSGSTKRVEEKAEEIEKIGVLPYSLQLMRERIAGMVDDILIKSASGIGSRPTRVIY